VKYPFGFSGGPRVFVVKDLEGTKAGQRKTRKGHIFPFSIAWSANTSRPVSIDFFGSLESRDLLPTPEEFERPPDRRVFFIRNIIIREYRHCDVGNNQSSPQWQQ